MHSDETGEFGDGSQWAMHGRCNRNITEYPNARNFKLANATAEWYYGYCPTSLSWLPILGMVLYLCCFSAGYGPMPWTINAEIFPNWARSAGTSLSTTFNWLFNLLISLTFLTLAKAITREGAYFLYAGITLIGLVWFYMVLPETKNKPIEEIQELLMGPWFTRGREPKKNIYTEAARYGGVGEQETSLNDGKFKGQQPNVEFQSSHQGHVNPGYNNGPSAPTEKF